MVSAVRGIGKGTSVPSEPKATHWLNPALMTNANEFGFALFLWVEPFVEMPNFGELIPHGWIKIRCSVLLIILWNATTNLPRRRP